MTPFTHHITIAAISAILLAPVQAVAGPFLSRTHSADQPERTSVDLGLRDGDGNAVLFAKWNVGAESETDYGDYYAWGETKKRYDSISGSIVEGGNPFDRNGIIHHVGSDEKTGWTKYVPSSEVRFWSGSGAPDGKLTLDPSDDAAAIQWGDGWRMPTYAELRWLVDNCTWSWKANYKGSGIKGFLVTGKGRFSSASIFLPAAGSVYGTARYEAGETGNYWSSSVYSAGMPGHETRGPMPYNAAHVFFSDKGIKRIDYMYRFMGYSIRPVKTVPVK